MAQNHIHLFRFNRENGKSVSLVKLRVSAGTPLKRKMKNAYAVSKHYIPSIFTVQNMYLYKPLKPYGYVTPKVRYGPRNHFASGNILTRLNRQHARLQCVSIIYHSYEVLYLYVRTSLLIEEEVTFDLNLTLHLS